MSPDLDLAAMAEEFVGDEARWPLPVHVRARLVARLIALLEHVIRRTREGCSC